MLETCHTDCANISAYTGDLLLKRKPTLPAKFGQVEIEIQTSTKSVMCPVNILVTYHDSRE